MPRHNTDLALARRDNTRAVWTNKTDTQLIATHLCIEHIQSRNALSDADNQFNACISRLQNGVFTKCRRNINHRRIGTCLRDRITNGVEYRQSKMLLTALTWRHAANHLCTVSNRLLRM